MTILTSADQHDVLRPLAVQVHERHVLTTCSRQVFALPLGTVEGRRAAGAVLAGAYSSLRAVGSPLVAVDPDVTPMPDPDRDDDPDDDPEPDDDLLALVRVVGGAA